MKKFLITLLPAVEDAGSRIRTHVDTKPLGPKPSPFDHSGIPATRA